MGAHQVRDRCNYTCRSRTELCTNRSLQQATNPGDPDPTIPSLLFFLIIVPGGDAHFLARGGYLIAFAPLRKQFGRSPELSPYQARRHLSLKPARPLAHSGEREGAGP